MASESWVVHLDLLGVLCRDHHLALLLQTAAQGGQCPREADHRHPLS